LFIRLVAPCGARAARTGRRGGRIRVNGGRGWWLAALPYPYHALGGAGDALAQAGLDRRVQHAGQFGEYRYRADHLVCWSAGTVSSTRLSLGYKGGSAVAIAHLFDPRNPAGKKRDYFYLVVYDRFIARVRHGVELLDSILRITLRRCRWCLPAGTAVARTGAYAPAASHWHIDRFEWLPDDQRLHVAGWAWGTRPPIKIAVMVGGRLIAELDRGLLREDVAAAFPDFADARFSGFDAQLDIGPLGSDVGVVAIVAKNARGAQTSLLRQSVFVPACKQRWSALLDQHGIQEDDVFYVPIATSHVAQGGAEGIKETFGRYESRTVKVGFRVQILYLRTTRGAALDYVFDPDFVADKRCGDRLIAEDGLNDAIRYAVEQQMPVLFTLNGGIWADSACEAVDWDVNDALERDESLCQWNEKNQVMPDTALADLPGSVASPELGRSLSLNVYMTKARFYKKRNLQQAAALVARFAAQYPALFIGVALDPDVYINPFFEGTQWYDYNPATLRQFRHWLRGDGPYAGDTGGDDDVPDLSVYRRASVFTLDEIDALVGRHHASWDEVDPPRKFPTELFGRPFWKSPWFALWEQFKRHLVKLHYDELSQWVAEAGISPGRIYSAQGFMQPLEKIDPLPVRLDSPAKNYDAAGVSIEGAVPAHGRLGAILYGESAANSIRMEGAASLFAEFRAYSAEWAVVEYNTTHLLASQHLGTYAEGYRSLRDIANYGARFVSPMAWNGSPGETAGRSDFRGYTALRRTPLEEAITHFMLARADLPRRARLWTFGAAEYVDGDGWQVNGEPVAPNPAGVLSLPLDRQGGAALVSPAELACRAGDYQAVVVQAQMPDAAVTLEVHGQADDGHWITLCTAMAWRQFKQTAAGAWVPLACAEPAADAQQSQLRLQRIRLSWRGQPGAALTVRSVALYPRSRGR